MSLIIEITSTEIKSRSGVSARTGRPYTMREQIGYLHKQGEGYPEKIKITLEDNQTPYSPGNYNLAPSSFYVDKYDSLAVRPVLVGRPAEQAQPSLVNNNSTDLPVGVKSSRA